ncbi:MAG: hemolysin family protein [Lentisphaeria bacterium]
MTFLFEFFIVLAMLATNAVFAAYEMALASTSRSRLAVLVQLGRSGARAAMAMKDRLERSLAVVQVGITLAGAIAAAVGGAGVDQRLAPWLMDRFGLAPGPAQALALTVFVLPLSGLTITFAELVPKMFAIRHAERVLLLLSPVMRFLAVLFGPVVWLFEAVVKRAMRLVGGRPAVAEPADGLLELRAAATLARASRVIGALEEKIVVAAAQFSHRPVREVMLPAAEICMIPEGLSLAEALVRAHLYMHTRIPVCTEDGNPQTIRGYVTFKDIVTALKTAPDQPSVAAITRPIPQLPATLPLAAAMERMIRERTHIALVAAPDGAVAGLMTLEDIVEELVGDIHDEYDHMPGHLHPLGAGWLAGGGVAMAALMAALKPSGAPVAGPDARPLTLAEWCARHAGDKPIPAGGTFTADGLEVGVRKLRGARVAEALVRLAPVPAASRPHA